MEDTRQPMAVTRLLTAIDAQDVLRGRDGYRPHLGAWDAGDTLTIMRPCGRDHGEVEAEMQGVFDHLDQEGMIQRWAQRIEDWARRRLPHAMAQLQGSWTRRARYGLR